LVINDDIAIASIANHLTIALHCLKPASEPLKGVVVIEPEQFCKIFARKRPRLGF
jgi:hypothetical protein